MPTFQSIPIHPSLRSRLQGDDVCENDSRPQAPRQPQNPQRLAKSGVSIPRSLLTRDLKDLVETVSRGECKNESQKAEIAAQMESIRFQVACKMISKTRNGKRLASLEENEKENDGRRKRQKPLIPRGSMSVFEAWRSQSKMQRNKDNQLQAFSTGIGDLDDLIAFPAEYCFGTNGFQLSTVDFVSDQVKGIPLGYVLKLSGATGKTQLCLQLASQYLLQSKVGRIRYCYSTAGHAGHPLAQRFFQLVETTVGRSEKKVLKEAAKRIEFQPIATVSQLTATVASLEREWMEAYRNAGDEGGKGKVSVLVLDALPLMMPEGEDFTKIQSLQRWLKRLARQYSVMVIIGTTGAAGRSSSIYDNAMSPDIHIQLQQKTSTTISIQLLRHPARPVTKNDCIVYTPTSYNA